MRRVNIWLMLVSMLLAACSKAMPPAAPKATGSQEKTNVEPAEVAEAASQTVLVSVAASTKDVLEELIKKFNEREKAEIKLNPGSTSSLAKQIIEGAPADLFLSANRQWADTIAKEGLVDKSVPLLTNSLVIVVPRGNPANITKPEDLTGDAVKKIALAGESVPAGMYADQALKSLKLFDELSAANKIVRGQDVRVALSYVERGEAEAGIVYSTDASISDKVETAYTFDPGSHDEIVYVLALLKHGEANASARKFFDFLQADAAIETLKQFGFQRLPVAADAK